MQLFQLMRQYISWLNFQGHVFEIIAYLANMTADYDFLDRTEKSMYELEAGAKFLENLSLFHSLWDHWICTLVRM